MSKPKQSAKHLWPYHQGCSNRPAPEHSCTPAPTGTLDGASTAWPCCQLELPSWHAPQPPLVTTPGSMSWGSGCGLPGTPPAVETLALHCNKGESACGTCLCLARRGTEVKAFMTVMLDEDALCMWAQLSLTWQQSGSGGVSALSTCSECLKQHGQNPKADTISTMWYSTLDLFCNTHLQQFRLDYNSAS